MRSTAKSTSCQLDNTAHLIYNAKNSFGGTAMLHRFGQVQNVNGMLSAAPAWYWQSIGLTLRYPFSE